MSIKRRERTSKKVEKDDKMREGRSVGIKLSIENPHMIYMLWISDVCLIMYVLCRVKRILIHEDGKFANEERKWKF